MNLATDFRRSENEGRANIEAVRSYPRILLLSPSVFNPYSGGGITLSNLFKGWPKEAIAVAHQDPIAPDTRVCENYYRLNSAEVRYFWPLNLFQHDQVDNSPLGNHESSLQGSSSMVHSRRRRSLGERAAYAVLRGLDGSRFLGENVRISEKLSQWVAQFRPQLVYSILGDLTYIRLTELISSRFAVPVAIHIMDDWPSTRYTKGLLAPWLHNRMNTEFLRLVQRAAMRMGICQDMCQEYQRRYGVPFLPFHNALDVEQWASHSKRHWVAGKPFTIVYSGSIEDVQVDALQDLCRTVLELHGSGLDIVFNIHTPWFYAQRVGAKLEKPPVVSIRDVPEAPSDVARMLANADLLVLAYNFDPEAAHYFRFSMPTKVPAYMISGAPVLLYGPSETAVMNYAKTEGWGYIVNTRDREQLKGALTRLIADQTLRETLGRRAQVLAHQNHDAALVRKRFHQALIEAV
jgi:glycosyltransferase involved in cell wall biosynthesis